MADSQFFPVADQIRNAGSHAERAQILLKLSDIALIGGQGDLQDACKQCQFAAGDLFITWRINALCRTRDAHGLMPNWLAHEVELWREAMSRIAAGVPMLSPAREQTPELYRADPEAWGVSD